MSGSKSARRTSSIINRANCGGIKKVGLSTRVGRLSSNTSAYNRTVNTGPIGGYSLNCLSSLINTTKNPTQQYGHRALFSGVGLG